MIDNIPTAKVANKLQKPVFSETFTLFFLLFCTCATHKKSAIRIRKTTSKEIIFHN